ncbi:thioredoxin family protein [Adlercreutzia sp. ZJ473]|uniref:thioredoxin family protein n=1 Tax=Adlercreutzia sp. ZJ473 TaxID=2722822 RepID=UPI001552A96D|nr:thioredoxin family protein [Adlercreutzia sp. ZJ473]
MGLFGKMFGKDKDEKKSCCCEMEIVEAPEDEETTDACGCGRGCEAPFGDAVTLTVLGPGCKRCHELNDNALAVAVKPGRTVNVEYVTDPIAIAEAGIMSTPALLVDGKVVSQGKVLTAAEIEGLL